MNLNVKLNESFEVDKYPYYMADLYRDNPRTSFPSPMTVEVLAAYRVYPVVIGTPPDGGLTHQAVEVTPTLIGGEWVQQWELVPLDPEVVAANLEQAEAARQSALWQSAHDYEFQQVSGSAIGLLAMGVMMGKPKCAAVQNWIKGIWTVYYTRKATGSHDTDFSVAGSIPHTVPELMQELGV